MTPNRGNARGHRCFDKSAAKQLLAHRLANVSGSLDPSQGELLIDYLAQLHKWNRVHNLTALRDPGEMVERHLLESLLIRDLLQGQRILDAGSGAGLPGIPLAVCEPQRRFTLVERNAKKAAFLHHVVHQLSLSNVAVQHGDLLDYRPVSGFATVVARALAPVRELLSLVAHLLAGDGLLLALKGPKAEQELAELPSGFHVDALHRLATAGRDNRVVAIRALASSHE